MLPLLLLQQFQPISKPFLPKIILSLPAKLQLLLGDELVLRPISLTFLQHSLSNFQPHLL